MAEATAQHLSRTSSATANEREDMRIDSDPSSSPDLEKSGVKDEKDMPEPRIADADEMDREDDNALILKALAAGDPLPEVPDQRPETQFTFRALFIGCVCGGLINASNLYIGMKTGVPAGAGIFGALVGFTLIGAMGKILPVISGSEAGDYDGPITPMIRLKRFFKLGGYFGPKENLTILCCATAASSNAVIFYSAVPALFQLKLLTGSVHHEFGKLVALSAVCCYWGMFFAVPFRRLYVIDQNLPFPGAVASSILIRTLHTAKGAIDNKRRMWALMIAFTASVVWKTVTEYAPGILQNWHVFWALYRAGSNGAVQGDNWGWYISWSPAYIGIGMIIGANGSLSVLGGQVLGYGLIGPAMVAAGAAVGTVVSATYYPGYISYQGASPGLKGVQPPSPRYWLLWPGIILIMVATFVEIGCSSKEIYRSLAGIIKRATGGKRTALEDLSVREDPAPRSQRIPWWIWLPGAVAVGIFTAAVLSAQFEQSVTTSVIVIVVTLAFSFVTCESVGRVSIAGVSATLTQLLFVAYASSRHLSPAMAAYSNILASAVSISASQQIGDMVEDLKTVHLLRSSPRMQFFSQVVGAVVATLLSPSLFLLFADVYPCILSADPTVTVTCSFTLPDAVVYRAFAAAAGAKINVPLGSILFAVFLGLFAAFTIIGRHMLWIPKRWHPYIPAWIAVGIGLLLPQGNLGIAFAMGGVGVWLWQKKSPATALLFAYPIAAGMTAGEGIGGIITAILQIANVGGDRFGTVIGCPWEIFCG